MTKCHTNINVNCKNKNVEKSGKGGAHRDNLRFTWRQQARGRGATPHPKIYNNFFLWT
tara:strand:+ start:310 stop:483 length:174 start_codon:yes stop_codon:yes gene_type:complete